MFFLSENANSEADIFTISVLTLNHNSWS